MKLILILAAGLISGGLLLKIYLLPDDAARQSQQAGRKFFHSDGLLDDTHGKAYRIK